MPRSGVAGSYGTSRFNFLRHGQTSPQQPCHFAFPPAAWGSRFSTSSQLGFGLMPRLGDAAVVIVLLVFLCRDIQETQMKYLSEWDQWKRYSSNSWKRFVEKAREMTSHLELWREDIRSIEGTTHPTLCAFSSAALLRAWGTRTASFSLTSSWNPAVPSTMSGATAQLGLAEPVCVFVTRKITDVFLSLPVVGVILECPPLL